MNLSRRLATVAAVLPLLSLGCASNSDSNWPDRPGPKVVVSFAPLYCLAANVAGDDAVVKNVMTTTGPHNFQPTVADAELVRKADLMFINGLGLDDNTAKKLKDGSGNAGLRVIDLGSKLDKDKLMEGVCHHDHAHEGDHEHGTDPHVWLGLDEAAAMVGAIRDELKAADPAHAAGYDARAAAYVKKLQDLKAEGVALLKGKEDKRFVSFHESLNYFARTFGLKVSGVVMTTPGAEPNAKQMEDLVKMCGKKGVRVIAVEPQYTTNTSAKVVLDELSKGKVENPVLVEVDPLETVRAADLTPNWYERKMRENVEALAKAMK